MELAYALVEKRLGLRMLAGDFEFYLTGPRNEMSALPRTFVESFSMQRVTRLDQIRRANACGLFLRTDGFRGSDSDPPGKKADRAGKPAEGFHASSYNTNNGRSNVTASLLACVIGHQATRNQ